MILFKYKNKNKKKQLKTSNGTLPETLTFTQPDLGYNIKEKNNNKTDIDSLLNLIFPPRKWSENSGIWLQTVSPYLSTRDDILRLQTNLEQELDEREARYIPICPVREDLFTQAYGINYI